MITVNHIKAIDVTSSILDSSPAENWKVLYGEGISKIWDLEGVCFYVVDRDSAEDITGCRVGVSLLHEPTFDLYVWVASQDLLVL